MHHRVPYTMRYMTLFLSILSTAHAVQGSTARHRLVETEAWESITPYDTYSYCREIASDKYAGRLTGHEGYTAAARWAAGMFAKWGLKGAGDDGGFLQEYPSPYTIVDSASMTLIVPQDGGSGLDTLRLEPGTDFLPQLYTGSGKADAGIVFAGWGISAPGLGYDDYAGIDVEGSFVLCFRGVPDRENRAFEEHDMHDSRMRTARRKGALGLFYIYDDPIANPNGMYLEGFMPAIVSAATADRILAEKGLSSADLKKRISRDGRPGSFGLSARVRYEVSSRHFPEGRGYNVAARIDGSSPEYDEECVVVGGHFDHCGKHMGMVFPGANDNGSGSATVMEIAEAFSMLEQRPRRSVLFVLFGGEEKGLEGSNWFAGNLPAGLGSVDVMLNFDMTGEGEGANCGYTADPAVLQDILETAGDMTGSLRRTWKIERVGVRSSDYAPFFRMGAGCIALFSNGPHLHYHKTGDTIYRINPDIMADIARLGFAAAYMAADREQAMTGAGQ